MSKCEKYAPYFAGFIDSDGAIYVNIQKPNPKYRNHKYKLVPKVIFSQYFAGVIDGDGSIKVCIKDRRRRRRKTKIGFEFQPMVTIKTDSSVLEIVNAFKRFCSCLGVKPFVSWHKTYVTFGVSGRESVKRLLKAVEPYLIIKKREADIMLKKIIPMMEQGKHLTKEGILEIMPYIDQMNKRGGNKRKKYTTNYFRMVFGSSLGGDRP